MPQSPPAASRNTEPIPGYHLRQRIGAGGYGEVWAAEAPGQLIKAIKFVFGFLDGDRAARELKALNRIKGVRHPFLLSLERIEVVEGQLVIVTELADASLKERFEACVKEGQSGIPRDELLHHLCDAADALDYMNVQHSLQHLDVKPENLLLVGGRIKVADFGLVKDMQEVSASMMGGLTPIYAPPEAFDARPSRRSDQYSLAIVFQEMLTGVLPFPGKTAAQLAVQHLNAKPRLAALPPTDQPIIARALSKDPAKRFGSCREMVEALIAAGGSRVGTSGPAVAATPSPSGAEPCATAMLSRPLHPSAADMPAEGSLQTASRSAQEMLGGLESAQQALELDADGQYEAAERAAQSAAQNGAEDPSAGSGVPLVDCPPLEIPELTSMQPPTLFVGVGGLAGRTLRQLRRRFEDDSARGAPTRHSLLLIDSDQEDLLRLGHEGGGTPLRPEESLATPLRKSTEYRADSGKFLNWLSRRWLFNIPRSQQTEGIRPFGRLVFADHAEQILVRLRGAIQTALRSGDPRESPAGAAAKSSAEGPRLRVVLMGSAAGGTSSGMLLDLLFTIRQILDELRCPAAVHLVLIYGASRQSSAQELAAINAYALLTELNQFLQPGAAFPGDPACGLSSRPGGSRAADEVYLAHLGQELTSEQFAQGCDRIAEFLYLDAATPVGVYLASARKQVEDRSQRHGVMLRSFGLCLIGFAQDDMVRGESEQLCRAVVRRWQGEWKKHSPAKLTPQMLAVAQSAGPTDAASNLDAELDAKAEAQAATLGISIDALSAQVTRLADQELGEPAPAFFQMMIQEAVSTGVTGSALLDNWFQGSAQLFGARRPDLPGAAAVPLLQTALSQRIGELVLPLGEQIRTWLHQLPEMQGVRVYGAQRCVKWFQAHLKRISETLRSAGGQINQELDTLEQRLAQAFHPDPKARPKNAKEPLPSPDVLFAQHCRCRLQQLVMGTVMQFVQGLAAYVTEAGDRLHDLSREVRHLETSFALSGDARMSASASVVVPDLANLRALAENRLHENEEALTSQIDERLCESLFASHGFRETIMRGGAHREELLSRMRLEARRAVLERLSQIDLTAELVRLQAAGGGQSPLHEFIASAQPELQQVGGERRLLCIVPSSSQASVEPWALAAQVGPDLFREKPAVLPFHSSDVVFCYELGGIPLGQVAARLIDQRPDYAEAAARLQTRIDIEWQALPLA